MLFKTSDRFALVIFFLLIIVEELTHRLRSTWLSCFLSLALLLLSRLLLIL